MSTPLTPTPTAPPSTYPLIAPGDGVTSANFAQTAQPVINSIAWLQSKLPGANPSTALLDLLLTTTMGIARPTSSDWTIKAVFTDPDVRWKQQNSVSWADAVGFPLDSQLRQGMVIRAFACDFLGASGHSALPVTMPFVQLHRLPRGTGTNTQAHTLLGSVTDSSATVVAYEKIHTMSLTLGTPETVDLSAFRYVLLVYGESSTNAVTGSVILDARISVSA